MFSTNSVLLYNNYRVWQIIQWYCMEHSLDTLNHFPRVIITSPEKNETNPITALLGEKPWKIEISRKDDTIFPKRIRHDFQVRGTGKPHFRSMDGIVSVCRKPFR